MFCYTTIAEIQPHCNSQFFLFFFLVQKEGAVRLGSSLSCLVPPIVLQQLVCQYRDSVGELLSCLHMIYLANTCSALHKTFAKVFIMFIPGSAMLSYQKSKTQALHVILTLFLVPSITKQFLFCYLNNGSSDFQLHCCLYMQKPHQLLSKTFTGLINNVQEVHITSNNCLTN